MYDPKRGGAEDLSVLDVQQILGRAGRPQYDTSGVGVILTTHSRLAHYLGLLMRQTPIESQLLNGLGAFFNLFVHFHSLCAFTV